MPSSLRGLSVVLFLSSIGWIYAGTIAGLAREWTSSPDTSYGVVLVAVAGALVWRRRAVLHPASPPPFRYRDPLLLLFGLALYGVGQLGADVFLTRVSLVTILAGAVWFAAGGAAARALAAPLVFLLIAIPLPTLIVNAVTLPMQLTASRIAEHTLTAAGMSVFRDGNVLELPSSALEVAEACSGLRSAVSLAAIAMLLAWTESGWPRRAALVLMSVPIAIVMNGLRITATAFASEAWGQDAATGSWHVFTGWVTFVASVALLVAMQRAIGGGRRVDARQPASLAVSA